MNIPFNKPYMLGRELEYIRQAYDNGHLSGDGPFTLRCNEWLKAHLGEGQSHALLTHSCTAALEMAGILAGIGQGDEVLMPSFTFVSTANAFAIRGAVPVFVDIRPDTLNMDESLIEAALSPRTRAIVAVHYAGVACEMDPILRVAEAHGLSVIEDAAQGVMATYKGRQLGSIGRLGALSFHETKNVISGEGGALLINDPALIERAEVIREKGTNRIQFNRGEVDKYTWVDLGSSYLPSEIIAAFLMAQLEEAETLTARRIALWERYHAALEPLERAGKLRRPVVPGHCTHNGHMYYILLNTAAERTRVLGHLKSRGVGAVFHYIPLHNSPAGRKYGRTAGVGSEGGLPVTEDVSGRILRLPLWTAMGEAEVSYVLEAVESAFN